MTNPLRDVLDLAIESSIIEVFALTDPEKLKDLVHDYLHTSTSFGVTPIHRIIGDLIEKATKEHITAYLELHKDQIIEKISWAIENSEMLSEEVITNRVVNMLEATQIKFAPFNLKGKK